MSSGNQGKLLIFSLVFAPSIILGVGIIPAIFLIFGIYMMKKNEDFSNIETAVRYFKLYVLLLLIGCLITYVYWVNESSYLNRNSSSNMSYNFDDLIFGSLLWAGVAFAYLIVVQVLFYNPLNMHREWVEVNSIFSTKPKSDNRSIKQSEVDIIKGKNLKQYSVADELTKWAKLKEDGHISEEEFNEARTKLLKGN